MSRTRHQTDAAVAVTAAQAAAITIVGGATAVTSAAADDLNTFSVEVVADLVAIKIEIAAMRAKLGI